MRWAKAEKRGLMTISLLIDLAILLGLAGAITYGVLLSRRIVRLQRALLELAPALQSFCDAVDQSEKSVSEIRREADRLQEQAKVVAAKPAAPPNRSDLVKRFFDTAKMRAGH